MGFVFGEKTCKQCGASFLGHIARKLCGSCSNSSVNERNISCQYCGKEVRTHKSNVKYCNKACRKMYHKLQYELAKENSDDKSRNRKKDRTTV